jgi:hypothetical protein
VFEGCSKNEQKFAKIWQKQTKIPGVIAGSNFGQSAPKFLLFFQTSPQTHNF